MKVFVIAGEPSGDALGQSVMAGLRELAPDVTFQGIGGPLMESEGLRSQFDMAELSLMGLVEILPKYLHLKRRIAQTAEAVLASEADVLLTIDSPDFCLRVAKAVRAKSAIKTVHYVAPSVWAWRPGRAAKMAAYVDHVLALLPFEPPYMTQAGMGCDFVGHPISTHPRATQAEVQSFRRQHRITGPTVLALPGSRASEIRRLSPIFADALRRVMSEIDGVQIIVPVAGNVASLAHQAMEDWPGRPIIIPPAFDERSQTEKRAAFAAADVALAASGTVSIELAAARTPMVIAYDMAWISRTIMQRMLQTDTVTLVNLVSESRVVPEFIGKNCRADAIADSLLATLQNPDAQNHALDLTMDRLGQGGENPGLRAARAIIRLL